MDNEETKKKDITKEKIILFVIGLLTGAVISTGAFFAYIKLAGVGANSTNNTNQSSQMPGDTPPEMPSGNQSGTPPEMPSGDQSGTPPEIPNNENGENSNNSGDTQNNQDTQNTQGNSAPTKPNKTNSKDKTNKSQSTNS